MTSFGKTAASVVTIATVILAANAGLADPIGLVVQKPYFGAIGMLPGGSAPEELSYQSIVQTNEKVQTADGGTALKFVDSTNLAIGAHSNVVLDRFVFDPETAKRDSVISLAKGILRLTSGAKPHNGDLSIDTPVAVLTIRGTDVIVDVSDDGAMSAHVLEGLVEIKTCNATTVFVHQGQTAKVSPKCLVMVSSLSHQDADYAHGLSSGGLGIGSGSSVNSGPVPGTDNAGREPGTGNGSEGNGGHDNGGGNGGDPGGAKG